MTLFLCKDCYEKDKLPRQQCFMELELYPEHMRLKHEQQIVESILYTKRTIKERVPYILEKSRSAQSNPGWLAELYYRYFPFKKKYRVIYDAASGEIETPRMPANIYADFLRNTSSVFRIDRAVRRAHPEWNGSPRAQVKREIQEEFSTREWVTSPYG